MDPHSCYYSMLIWQMAVLGVFLTFDNSRVLSLGVIHALPSPWLEVRLDKMLGNSHFEGIAHALPSKGL